MLFMLQVLLTIALWEFGKAIKREMAKQDEFKKGLRWKCPDCENTQFASNDAKVVTQMIVQHDMAIHHKEAGDA